MARVRQKTRGAVAQSPAPAATNRTIALVGIAIVVALVLGLLIWIGTGGGSSEVSTATADDPLLTGRIIGDPNAPLLIRDFSDFRCPHCRDAAATLTPKIIEEYVRTGQARLEFIPVAVLGEESVLSAQAALCAEEQGSFWPYHDRLFDRQGRDTFNIENLTSFAGAVGMDAQALRDCVVSGQFRNQLQENNLEFQRVGGTGTPTFIIGDELVSGVQDYDAVVKPLIEDQLGAGAAE